MRKTIYTILAALIFIGFLLFNTSTAWGIYIAKLTSTALIAIDNDYATEVTLP